MGNAIIGTENKKFNRKWNQHWECEKWNQQLTMGQKTSGI